MKKTIWEKTDKLMNTVSNMLIPYSFSLLTVAVMLGVLVKLTDYLLVGSSGDNMVGYVLLSRDSLIIIVFSQLLTLAVCYGVFRILKRYSKLF